MVALSEGEETLFDVYSEFRRTGEAPKGIGGTLTLDPSTGELVKKDRRLLRLDQLPAPSFDEIPIHAYQPYENERALPFQLSRGCTDRCSFCSEWVFWKNFRNDAPDHAVEQLKELKHRYDVNLVQFTDSLLNGHQKRLIGFAEQLLHDGLDIGWTGFMRANMDAETAKLIRRAGCTAVFIGVESFSDEALELMNKRRTEADNIQAITTFLEHGIHVTAGFIPGFPGDSRRGFLHSVQVMRDLQHRYPGRLQLHEEPFTVMANAPIHGKLHEMGLTPQPWAEEYLDIAPRYRDMTSSVHCSVEGPEQGLERLGRMTVVGTIKTDAPVRSRFDEGEDEPLSVQSFDFTPMFGGYYLGTLKAPAGHRYCLLVDDEEWQQLVDLEEECYPLDLADQRVSRLLDRIEASHLLGPDRNRQRMVRFLYRRELADDDILTVSPLVVARDMGWRQRRQILFIDTVTDRVIRKKPAVAAVVTRLKENPHSIAELWRDETIRRAFRNLAGLRREVHELKELGIVMMCDTGQAAVARSEAAVTNAAAEAAVG